MARLGGWLKLLGALGATAVLGAAAVLVGLKAFFPEPKLRAMVLDGARKQLGREVSLEHIGLGLRGLTLTGLKVSESPDFAAGTFVSVETFHVRPAWRALLKKKLVVATVVADGLKLSVVKEGEGRFNFSDLAASTSAASAPSASAAPGEKPEFSIRHVRVSGGEVLYRDVAAKQQWKLSELDLGVEGFTLLAPFDADVSVRVQGDSGGRPVDAKLAFEGSISPAHGDVAKMKVDAKSFSVETEGLTLKGSADVAGLQPPVASFDVKLAASGKSLLTASGEVKLSSAAGGDFHADVKAESPGLDTTLIAKWLPQVPAVTLPPASLKLKAERRGSSLDVKTFALKWADGGAEGHLGAKGLGTAAPAYDGKVVLDLVLPAVAKGQYPFLKLPPDLSVPSAKVRGELELSGDSARFSGFKVTLPQGTVSVNGSVAKLGSAKPVPDVEAVLALDLPSVKASELPVKLPPSVPPSFVIPAVKLNGGVSVKGEDVRLKALKAGFAGGSVTLDGAVLGALGAKPRPEMGVTGTLAVPALTDKDLPFAGVPEGLKLPATSWEADLDYTLERLRVRSLRVKLGGNDVAVEGTIGDPAGRMAYDLLVKVRSFVLDELTQLTPATRGMELKGSGYTALSVTGAGDKPVFAGKAQFKGAGATVAGLPLSEFNGTASFDEHRLDIPNVTGKVADGSLSMDLTVRDYAKAPNIELEAKLDRFDLGRFLDAKKKLDLEKEAAAKAKAGGAAPAAARGPDMRSKGSLEVGQLQHPNAIVSGLKLTWDLTGINAADLRPLNGESKLSVTGGTLKLTKDIAGQNPAVKVLLVPFTIIQGIGKAVAGFPKIEDTRIESIAGDYQFVNGVMHLRENRLVGSDPGGKPVDVSAAGAIDLPHEGLDLVVTANMGRVLAPMDVAVKGTISAPKTNLKIGKFVTDGLINLLQKAAKPQGE